MPTLVTLVDGTIPVAADFNGNYQALNAAIGSGTTISTYATGDTLYASATNTLSKLVKGTVGQVLQIGVSTPAWGATSVGGCFLSNNGSDATNDIDISVGARFSDDAAFTSRTWINLASALTKQLDATWAVGTNAGMRASGAAIANTTYHIFLIMRPDTGVVDVAADTSATGANLAANTDAAYTKKWRIGSILREAGAIVAFTQDGAYFRRSASSVDVNATNPGTSAVTATLAVPVGIKVQAIVHAGGQTTTATTTVEAVISDLGATDEAPANGYSSVTFTSSNSILADGFGPFVFRTNTSAQIRYRLSFSDANVTFAIRSIGWWDWAAVGIA